MDGGAWWAAVHGVARSRTRLSDFTFTFDFHALEKEMATHSSVLAWRIPWKVTGEIVQTQAWFHQLQPLHLPFNGTHTHNCGHSSLLLPLLSCFSRVRLCDTP